MSEALKNRKAFYNTTIPVDWDAYELTRVSEKIMVGIASAATHAYRNEGIILFRNQNIKEGYLDDSDILYIDETYEKAHKNKRLKGGDILIARTGYPGTACLVPDKYIGAQSFTTLIVRPKHELIDKEFLCLYVNSEFGQGYFETNQIGGGQKNVNAGTLETMPIPLPPLPEQKAIAQVLSTADAAIHTTEKLIAQKELRKKWLMQQLLTGKKRLLNDELKTINGEWKPIRIGDVFKFIKSYSISREGLKNDNEGSVFCIHYGDIHAKYDSSFLDFERQKNIPQLIDENISIEEGNYLQDGDIVMADVSEDYEGVGAAVEVKNLSNKKAIGGLHTLVLRADKKTISPDFAAYFFSSEKVRNTLRKYATGTSVYSVTKTQIHNLSFIIPNSLKEQTAIAQVLQAADKEISLLKAKAEKLREQKKGLMQVLLTGKKRLVF